MNQRDRASSHEKAAAGSGMLPAALCMEIEKTGFHQNTLESKDKLGYNDNSPVI